MQHSGRPERERNVVAPGQAQAASQSDAAFEEFVQARSAHLLRLALLLTGWNAAVAEDLTQTVLERALASVPPRQRAVLVLSYWEDLSDAEIAATLNCGLGTVRSQASRGLERLRRATDLRPGTASELSKTGERDE